MPIDIVKGMNRHNEENRSFPTAPINQRLFRDIGDRIDQGMKDK
jgi:hypothetical protein